MSGSLLVAGPAALDDLDIRQDLIGGGGCYAAIAAAPLVHTQLWSRLGSAYDSQLQGLLGSRGIDLAGADGDGTTSRWRPGDWQPGGPALGTSAPTDPGDCSAVLLIHLAGEDWQRASQVIGGWASRPLRLVRPHPAGLDGERLRQQAAFADLLLVDGPAAMAALERDDPLSTAAILQAAGARSVLLSHGAWGALLCYKQKTCTIASLPQPEPAQAMGSGATFTGVLAGGLAEHGHIDWRNLKRLANTAAGVAAQARRGPGPVPLLGLRAADYQQAFLRLRRNGKA